MNTVSDTFRHARVHPGAIPGNERFVACGALAACFAPEDRVRF